METIITANEQALQHVASKDKTRYNIGGVFFNCKHAVATNGHCLALVNKNKENTLSNKLATFSSATQKESRKGLREEKFSELGTKLIGNNPVNVATVEDVTYPDYKAVFKGADFSAPVSIHVSMKELEMLSKALLGGKKTKEHGITITLDSAGGVGGCLLVASLDNPDTIGILMPIRNDSKRSLILEAQAIGAE